MKFVISFAISFLVLIFFPLGSQESVYKFEGILGNVSENIENQNSLVPNFLPYNPVIIEIGAYQGSGTLQLSGTFPYGKIFCFEPNPRAFAILQANTNNCKNVIPVNLGVSTATGFATLYLSRGDDQPNSESQSSLLPLISKNLADQAVNSVLVPCVNLDAWCRQNQIAKVDFVRVDAGGGELQILKSSPKVLNRAIAIVVKTHFIQFRQGEVLYPELKQFLEGNGFELLAHWYKEGAYGEATFIRKTYFDSIFR